VVSLGTSVISLLYAKRGGRGGGEYLFWDNAIINFKESQRSSKLGKTQHFKVQFTPAIIANLIVISER
jgi:hypothetical protein